jgi:hypothetical protein
MSNVSCVIFNARHYRFQEDISFGMYPSTGSKYWIGPRMDFIPGVDGPSEGVPRVLACFSNGLLRGEPLKLVDGDDDEDYTDGKGDMEGTGSNGEDIPMVDDARQPLNKVVPLPSNKLTPYRIVIILRLIIVGVFFQYRVSTPVNDAYPLWLVSVICEVWFAVSWILDQFPKWMPINRETYLDRLALSFDREGEPSQLAKVSFLTKTELSPAQKVEL